MNEPQKSLKIESPCHMEWGALEGSGSRRWCDQCALHVVDGSSMSQAEATQLVEVSDERVCMRVVKDEQGRVVHASGGAAGRLLRYGLTAAAGVLAACSDEPGDGIPAGDAAPQGAPVDPPVAGPAGVVEPGRPEEIMGAVCYVEEMGDMIIAPAKEEPEANGGDSGTETDGESMEDGASTTAEPVAPPREIMGKVRMDDGPDLAPPGKSDAE